MKTALIFDTETTGASIKKDPSDPAGSKLCQIWAGLYEYDETQPYIADADTKHPILTAEPLAVLNTLVVPSEPPHPKAEEVHGFSMERLTKLGVQADSAAYMFVDLLARADVLVAHNLWFDSGIMRHHIDSVGLDFAVVDRDGLEHFCTMEKLLPVMKLTPKMYGNWKRPSLKESYRYLFQRDFENAHDAGADANACASIYFACKFLELK